LFDLLVAIGAHAADREKLLTEPGVFATFTVFAADVEWWLLTRRPVQIR
jgi:hypothetical protein